MRKLIEAGHHRNEFDKAVFTDAIIYTVTIGPTAAQKITNESQVSFGLSAGISATATQLSFDNLWGNIPWSSYSKFASTKPLVTSPSLPLASLPSAGAVVITEGGVGTETVYYGSVTWTPAAGPLPATTGTLNNLKRASATGGTSYAFTGAATCTFVTVIPVREYIKIWNRTNANLYIGDSAAIDNTPTNSVVLGANEDWGIWLEPLQNLWVYSAAGGNINIAEYR